MVCVHGLLVILLILCAVGIALATMGAFAFRHGMAKELQVIDIPSPSLDGWMDRCCEAGRRFGKWVVHLVSE